MQKKASTRRKIVQKSIGLSDIEWAYIEKKAQQLGCSISQTIRNAVAEMPFNEQVMLTDKKHMQAYVNYMDAYERVQAAYSLTTNNPYGETEESLTKAFPRISNIKDLANNNSLTESYRQKTLKAIEENRLYTDPDAVMLPREAIADEQP